MTDRLITLLHDEAAQLDLPAPRPAEILAGGRRIVRRRRLRTGAATLALVGVAGLGASLVLSSGGSSTTGRDGAPAGSPGGDASSDPGYGAVLADGAKVAVGEGRGRVPGTVHDLVFTSEGALVRSNSQAGASDGSGPEWLTLVRPDGTTHDLGTLPEGVGPATDPTAPLYALAEGEGEGFVAVLRDVRTGSEVARVALPDRPPSYWSLPPLALDGDHVYVGYEDETWAVDWTTGESAPVPGVGGGIPEVRGGRVITADMESVSVTDVATGEVLVTVSVDGYGFGRLSPDGASLLVTDEGEGQVATQRTRLLSVDTGRSRELIGEVSGFGWAWTASGQALGIGAEALWVCTVAEGCAEQPLPSGFEGELKPGGQRFES